MIFKRNFFKNESINNEVEVVNNTLRDMAWVSAQVHLCGP